MNFDEYRAIKAINFSSLKSMKKSPKEYKYRLDHGTEDSTGKALGRATHLKVLEPHKWSEEFAVFNGDRRAGPDWKLFEKENSCKTILKIAEAEHCERIAVEVRTNHVAAKYLANGKAEHTIQWKDKATQQDCKARIDFLSEINGKLYIVDLKGCQNVSLQNFRVEAGKNSYHRQLGFYKGGVETVYPGRDVECMIIGVEHKAPHDVCVYRMEEDSLVAGQEDCETWLRMVAECAKLNNWPGCYASEQELCIRKWELEIPEDEVQDMGLDFSEG